VFEHGPGDQWIADRVHPALAFNPMRASHAP
jgi:hypothetical protein